MSYKYSKSEPFATKLVHVFEPEVLPNKKNLNPILSLSSGASAFAYIFISQIPGGIILLVISGIVFLYIAN